MFAEQAFSGDSFYEGQTVELASQRLTMNEFTTALEKKVGRPVKYKLIPKPALWIVGALVEVTRTGGRYKTGWALLRMFDWMNSSPIGGWCRSA